MTMPIMYTPTLFIIAHYYLLLLAIFIVIIIIITCTKKVLLIVVYKLWDLCTTYRQMLCATLKLKLVGALLLIYVQVFRKLTKCAYILLFDSK